MKSRARGSLRCEGGRLALLWRLNLIVATGMVVIGLSAPTVAAQTPPSGGSDRESIYLPFADAPRRTPCGGDPGAELPGTGTPTATPCDTPALKATPVPTERASMTVRFFNVGQGDGAWIHTSDGFDVIVDGGPGKTTSGAAIATELSSRGIRDVDQVYATHPEADHIRGLITVVQDIPVGQFVHNGATAMSTAYSELAMAVATHAIPTHIARDGDPPLRWGCCVQAIVLNPVEPLPRAPNDGSIVLRVSHSVVDILLTGDIGSSVEGKILDRGHAVDAEILKIAHHGSNTSSSERFLTRVDPDIAIISASGAFATMPHPDVLSRLLSFGIEVLETRLTGDIEFVSDGVELRSVDSR